jgi:Domain of unknown function (DUF4347)/FG-GAP-like repeat
VTDSHPLQVVFIDSRVPDIQDLLSGLQPGEQAFVLDPNSDGVQQIADILAANDLTDLSSIAIVSHGETGELELGSSFVTGGNLAGHASALGAIGAALAPGGTVQLYGCDVAQGAAGQQFINDFSALTGGAQVEAATHIVGSAADGGSWALDASSTNGAAPTSQGVAGRPLPPIGSGLAPASGSTASAASSVPFTAAALANFQGQLVAPLDGQLYFRIDNGNDVQLGDINADSSARHTIYYGGGNNSTTAPGGNGNETSIAVDTAAGLVFSVGIGNNGSYDAFSVHNLRTGALISTTEFGPNTGSANTDDVVQALTIDPFTHTLYVGDWGGDNTTTGVRQFTYDPLTGALTPLATNGGFLFTAAQTETTPTNDSTTQFTNADAFYLDTTDHLLYYVDDNSGYNFSPFHPTNAVYVVSTNGPTFSPTQLTNNTGTGTGQFPTADQAAGTPTFVGANGNIVGLTVDVADGIVFFESTDVSGSANNALWWVSASGGANQTAHKITLPGGVTFTFAGQSSEGGDAAGLTFDSQLKQLYLSNADTNTPGTDAIYVLQWNNTSKTVSLVKSISTATLVGATPAVDEAPSTTTFDLLPVLTITGTSTSPTEHGSAVSLANSLTITDADGDHLAGATVSITSADITNGTFSPVGQATGDSLAFDTTGTSITASYNTTTETLTLSGYDTLAHYRQVLDTVTFTPGENPTNFGGDTTRTISWTANDGALGVPAGAQNSGTTTITITPVNDPPTLSGVAGNAHWTEEGGGATLASGLSVSDVDDLNLSSATVSITGGRFTGDGDVLAATAVGNVTVSYNASTETLTLSGTDTLAHYRSVLDSVTFNGGENPTNFGSNTTRTLTWQVQDPSGTANGGSDTSALSTTTLTITNVNDAPTLAVASANATWTEEQTSPSSVAIISSATASDPDNLSLASATVSISGGFFAGDKLSFTNSGNVSGSYNSTTGKLVFTGSDALATYDTVLQSVQFNGGENPTDYGSDTSRTLTWTVSDGTLSSTAASATLSVVGVNDPPTLSVSPANATWTEEQSSPSAASVISSAAASDPDNLSLASATVSISGGFFTGDTLSFANSGAVTGSYNSSTGLLVFTGSDTLATYDTVLQSVSFSGGENPTDFGSDTSRTLSWTVNDGALSSAAVTATLSVVGVNDPPTLSNVAGSAFFTEEGGAVTLSNAMSVADPDDLNLASATVSVTSGAFTGDVLAATGNGTIGVSYDSTNERLILTGSDTLAHYQSVLDTVTFNAGENPTDFGSDLTRTVTWVLNDGAGSSALSAPQTTTVSLTNVNDAPTLIGVPSNAAGSPSSTITLAPTVTVTDADDLKLASATVVVSGGTGDTLATSTAGTNITASYNTSTETLTLSGSDTLADYQTVLDRVTFATTSPGIRTVTWTLNDGGASNATSAPVTETVTFDTPPTLGNVAGNAAWTEEGPVTTLSSGIVVSDPDGVNTDNSATVSITGGTFLNDHDLLSANTTGTAISASYNSTTETLTLSGSDTLADYQQVLQTVTFSAGENPTDFGSNPTRTITWVIADSANVGSAPQTTTVSVTNVNDPPTLSNVATSAAFTEEGSPVTLSSAVSATDPDDLKLASATVSISGGKFSGDGDVLATSVAGTSITASYNTSSETLTLTGSDTLADYQQVLDAVTFNTAVENPSNFGSNPTRTLTWTLNDGAGSFSLSTPVTTTVSVTDVNDPPTLSNVATNASYTEEGAAATLSSAVAVTDPDNVNLAGATVRVTSGTFAGDGDVLATSVAGTSITASYNSATETLTLSGADTLAHYRQVLDAVTFAAGENPTNFGSNPTRTLTWTLNDGGASNNLSTVVTTTVSVTSVNDPPTLGNVAASAALATVGQTVTVAPALAVSDPDNLTLVNATVSVGGGFAGDGDVLGFNTAGTGISASYNSSTETLTLTGTDTLAHYQSVLDSVTFTSGANPTNSGANPTRSVSWVVNDGSASNNLSAAATTTINFQPLLSFVGIGDFDANTRSDIAWASNGGGKATLWMNNNGTLTQNPVPLGAMGAEWTAYGVGDFNGDGKSDLLWTNTTGQVAVWEMNGPNLIGFGVAAGKMGSEWHVAAIGDFNGDGKSDVLWTDTGGHAAVFTMNGTVMSGFAVSNGVMGSGWSALGSGDFNRDGRADVLWENTTSGTVDIWEMNGATLSGFDQNVGTAPGRFAGVGHFTGVSEMGNKTSDIVWVDNTNHVTIWEMSGGHIAKTLNLNGLDGTDWHLEGVGNFAGDTNSDLLWVSKSTGAMNIWEVNGSSVTEIPLNVPTGSTLQLKAGTQSAQQSAPQLMTLSDSDPGKTPHTLVG